MRRMLIVDDEPKICECLQQFFSQKGFAVVYVCTGTEAIEWLMDQAADVILLDVRLPDMKGTEVLRRARELYPEIKAVMVTAMDNEEPRVDAKVYGACAYITKPFDFSETTWSPVFADFPP